MWLMVGLIVMDTVENHPSKQLHDNEENRSVYLFPFVFAVVVVVYQSFASGNSDFTLHRKTNPLQFNIRTFVCQIVEFNFKGFI